MDDSLAQIVDRAIDNILTRGADDIFRPPLFSEHLEIDFLRDTRLRKSIFSSTLRYLRRPKLKLFGEIIKFPVPKTPYSYRHVCWIDVADLVKYSSLVLAIAPQIEEARLPRKENIVVSHRFSSEGPFFLEEYDYKRFRMESATIAKSRLYKVKIATDIANFYDRLNLHKLESTLASMKCARRYVKALNELLLFWAGRNSYGLPVGCDASRLLAEAALNDVDKELVRQKVKFVRYVDDYRIFATSFPEAHSHLNLLIELLDREGLFINTSKTVFFDLGQELSEEDSDDHRVPAVFDKIDEAEKTEHTAVVKVGYVSKIGKFYRYPGQEKVRELQELELSTLYESVMSSNLESLESNVKLFVQSFIYQGGHRADLLLGVIGRYVHSLTYVVDGLIKESGRLSDLVRRDLSNRFAKFYGDHRIAVYYKLMIIRLLCDRAYVDRSFIAQEFDSLRCQDSEIFIREFVLRMAPVADRSMILAMMRLYPKSALAIKRAIFDVVKRSGCILEAERYAWIKNISIAERDQYISSLAGRIVGGEQEGDDLPERSEAGS